MGFARSCDKSGRNCYQRNARTNGQVRTTQGHFTSFGPDHANNLHPTNSSVKPVSPDAPAIPYIKTYPPRNTNECTNDWAFLGTGGTTKVMVGK